MVYSLHLLELCRVYHPTRKGRTMFPHILSCFAHVTLPYGACALTYLLRVFWRAPMTSSHCSAGCRDGSTAAEEHACCQESDPCSQESEGCRHA